MNCLEILTEYLKKNGFDGLYHPDGCGCLIGGLFPCECDPGDCLPGYKQMHDEDAAIRDWIVGPTPTCKELEYYKAHKDEILKKLTDTARLVVIEDDQVVGVYESMTQVLKNHRREALCLLIPDGSKPEEEPK